MEVVDMLLILEVTLSEESCKIVEKLAFECMTGIRTIIEGEVGERGMSHIKTKALVDWSKTNVPAGAKGEAEWKLNMVKAGLPEEVVGETFNLTVIKDENSAPIEFRIDVTSCQINRHFGIRLGFDEIEVDGCQLNTLYCLYQHNHAWVVGNSVRHIPESWQNWQIAKIEQVTQ